MVNIIKEQQAGGLFIRLVGSIEESVNFEQIIGPFQGLLTVNSKEVPRINSVGVKAWIKYFQSLKAKNAQFEFIECSTSIVEQINLISNFTSGAPVKSIFVPFACEGCKGELVGLFKTDDIKKINCQIPALKCSKCGGQAVFDDIEDEYFGFLSR